MDTCLKCNLPLTGNTTLLQCWRADTPADQPEVCLMDEYCEIFTVCNPCANTIDSEHKQRVVIEYKGRTYVLDKMFDIKTK